MKTTRRILNATLTAVTCVAGLLWEAVTSINPFWVLCVLVTSDEK